jgi:glycosyltransferase involved in cell wall biosynthesis
MKPRIGILTTFSGSDEAYSLVGVVKVQLKMLLDAGYRPVLFAHPAFTGNGVFSEKRIEIRKPATPGDLGGMVGDIDVIFCHDIVFLSQHREWAAGICEVAKLYPQIAWLHWQHSRGDGQVSAHPERSWFAYPNQGDLQHCAEVNNTDVDHVFYVPHPLDVDYFGWPELAVRIAEAHEYPFVDVAGILPARLDRQKQVEKAVRIYAGLKRAGRSVSFLVADAYATGAHFVQYKREVEQIARDQGLTDTEFAFLGERYEECTYATPRAVVKSLFEMGNLFIQPSTAETSSLVVMEAALAGNLLVINADFPPIHHLYAKALALPFGSVLEDTKYYRHIRLTDGTEQKVEDPQIYWDDEARKTILPMLDGQTSITVKRQQLRERWPSKVFADYIQPLIDKIKPIRTSPAATGDPDVTAIITTLDNLPLLQRQIDILTAECGHVIVVNNGSKDGTREWLEANPYLKVSYINHTNRGAGPGRNAGLAMWDNSTPYTLMVDGGILPPVGAVKQLKAYLERHPEAAVVSPEVATCFTTEESDATLIAPALPDDLECFWQRCLSSTAFCLARKEAWIVRFSEEGPYGEPGWGVDDNDMAYRWDDLEIVHHEFTLKAAGWLLYRRASGSFKRIAEETGIGANQYGSVYERRNVKCQQDWRKYHAALYGRAGVPTASYIIRDVPMPEFAKLVKRLHASDPNCEIVVESDYDPEVTRWLDTFALRWPWGDTTIDPVDGKILHRGTDYPEELWSGDVVRNRGPLVDALIIDNVEAYDLANAA